MGPRAPIMLCTLLTDPHLLVESAATAAGDGGCESADGASSFKSDVWQHFGFKRRRRKGGEQTGAGLLLPFSSEWNFQPAFH